MSAGEYFRVDVDALTDAGVGLAELLGAMEQLALEDIDCDRKFIGHSGLADAYESFAERWAAGIENLTADGKEMSQRMLDAAGAYIEADTEGERKLRGFFDGMDDPGAEAIEVDG